MNKILAFDTLKYANRLKQINVPPEQAELQAEVMKEVLETAFQTAELATKSDVALVRKDMEAMEQRLGARIDANDAKIDAVEQRLNAKIDEKIDALANRLLIQMLTIVFAGMAATAAIVALLPRLF